MYLKTRDIWPMIQGWGIAFTLWLFRPPGYFSNFWMWLWYEHYYGEEGRGSIGEDVE